MLDATLDEGKLAEAGAVFLVTRHSRPRRADFLLKRMWHPETGLFKTETPVEFHHFEEGTGLMGTVLKTEKARWSNNATSEEDYAEFKSRPQLRSVACVPVKYSETLLAVLCIHNRERRVHLDVEDVASLEPLRPIATTKREVTMLAAPSTLRLSSLASAAHHPQGSQAADGQQRADCRQGVPPSRQTAAFVTEEAATARYRRHDWRRLFRRR